MVRKTTHQQKLEEGYGNIVVGAVILLTNLFVPVFFGFQILWTFLSIVMSGILICIGIIRVANARGALNAKSPEAGPKICPTCGSKIPNEAKFCPQCREPLAGSLE